MKKVLLGLILLFLPLIVSATATEVSVDELVQFTGEEGNEEAYGDQAGNAVSSDGDFNGDGYNDILIGAYTADDGLDIGVGTVYLIYGSENSLTSIDLSVADAHFHGTASNNSTGFAVASAGDVDNDGYDDILISAPPYGGEGNGMVYLVYGQAEQYSGNYDLDSDSDASWYGDSAGLYIGSSLASSGDANADGYDDFLIGVPNYSASIDGYGEGAVFMIYGQETRFSADAASLETAADVKFFGDHDGLEVELGYDIGLEKNMAVGNFNNDSYPDYAFIDYNLSSENAGLYIVYGTGSLTDTHLSSQTIYRNSIHGEGVTYSVTTGDVNNDNYDDIIVGCPNETDNGKVFIFYGDNLAGGTFSSADVVYNGGDVSHLGVSVASAGDVNNDGYDDILIGDAATEVYLVYGSSSLSSGTISDTAVIYFNDYGYSLSLAGDINNDSLADVVIGNPTNQEGGFNSGAAYLGYLMSDGDGDGVPGTDGIIDGTDCNDSDLNISATTNYYVDSDSDGYGSTTITAVCSSTVPAGYSTNSTDCSDTDSAVHENQTYYQDADGDGLGNPNTCTTVCSATPPAGYVANDDDTDDSGNSGDEDNIEIGGDGIDNDSDGTIDEVNTLSENGIHPVYGAIDPTDQAAYLNSIISVVGYSHGNILVTYADYSVYSYNIYSIVSKKKTKVKQYQNTGYYLVTHPWGKKLALVNVYNGEVLSRKLLSKKVKFKNNAIKIFTINHSKFVTIISKKKIKVRLYVVKLKISTTKLGKKAKALTENVKIKIKKTTKKKNSIYLNNKNGKHLKEYQLSYLKKKAKYKLYLVK
ncbi:MAG: FG-GAP-like repeat-containing protein [Patescibacteria group bacterium]|jgi:hypothetical protein